MPLIISSCATPHRVWDKPGATQEEFAKTNYMCLQQAQQQESNSSINLYTGNATTSTQTNNTLFNACMNAHGWYQKAAELSK